MPPTANADQHDRDGSVANGLTLQFEANSRLRCSNIATSAVCQRCCRSTIWLPSPSGASRRKQGMLGRLAGGRKAVPLQEARSRSLIAKEARRISAWVGLRAFPSAPRQAAIAARVSRVRARAQARSSMRLAGRPTQIEAPSIDGAGFG